MSKKTEAKIQMDRMSGRFYAWKMILAGTFSAVIGGLPPEQMEKHYKIMNYLCKFEKRTSKIKRNRI